MQNNSLSTNFSLAAAYHCVLVVFSKLNSLGTKFRAVESQSYSKSLSKSHHASVIAFQLAMLMDNLNQVKRQIDEAYHYNEAYDLRELNKSKSELEMDIRTLLGTKDSFEKELTELRSLILDNREFGNGRSEAIKRPNDELTSFVNIHYASLQKELLSLPKM